MDNHIKGKIIKRNIIVVQKPWSYIVFSCVFSFFDFALFFLLFWSSINTSYDIIGILFLIASVILKIWLVSDFLTWRMTYYNGFFKQHAWYIKEREYKVTDLKQVLEYYSWPKRRTVLVLYFNNGKKIFLDESYRGYFQLRVFLKKIILNTGMLIVNTV